MIVRFSFDHEMCSHRIAKLSKLIAVLNVNDSVRKKCPGIYIYLLSRLDKLL